VKYLRFIALLVVAAGIVAAIVYRDAIDPVVIQQAVATNPFAPVIFIGLQVAASLLFVPRTIVTIAAGLIFGFVWGMVWALIGAVLGAAAGFAFVRWFGATGVLDTSPGIGKLVERAEHGGWRTVAIIRLTPVPHSVSNTLLAMTNLSWRDYLLGSLLGMFPMTLAYVDIGASSVALLQGEEWFLTCLMLALGIAATFWLKRWGSQERDK
jgi:uncharacterized membrane protein YdjX (TVP38/TMEM64 family)